MEEFVLLMRHENGKKVASPEQMKEWMKQTSDWIGTLNAKSVFVDGIGLSFDDAKVLNHDSSVTDGPFGHQKETVGGYIIVEAETIEEAIEYAKGCPVLQGEGNTVEVRRISHDE